MFGRTLKSAIQNKEGKGMGMTNPGGYAAFAEQSRVGYARYLNAGGAMSSTVMRELDEGPNDSLTQKPEKITRTRHSTPMPVDWPGIVVMRKIDKTRSGPGWRDFNKKYTGITRRYGHAVELSKLACTFITATEFNEMLTRRYPEASRDTDLHRPVRIANGVVKKLNDTLQTIQSNRSSNQPQINILDCAYWQPTALEVEPVFDGAGKNTTVMVLVDEDSRFGRERQDILDILSSKKFGFNTSTIAADWRPEVPILETFPQLDESRLTYVSPVFPISMPFKEPHAYIERH